MRKSQIFVIVLFLLTLPVAVFAADGEKAGQDVVNINTADVAQLTLLPRVGAKAAERIIAYRTDNGPFKKPTDLMQVKGFGDKSFELLSSYIAVSGKTTLASKVKSPKKQRSSKSAAKQPANTASE